MPFEKEIEFGEKTKHMTRKELDDWNNELIEELYEMRIKVKEIKKNENI